MSDRTTGYIKLFRQITEWEHYKEPIVKDVFIHILLNSNYASRGEQTVPSGSLRITIKRIADETGYSYTDVRNALKTLTETGEICVVRAFRCLEIRVNQWSDFQAKTAFKKPKNSKEKNGSSSPRNPIDRGF